MSATISEQFIAIMPRHQRLLTDLWEQRKFDPFGGIGWRGLMDDEEMFTPEQLFNPLIERGLIEDLQEAHQNESGKFFVHITALGIMCMNFGQMLRDPRKPYPNELKQITAEAKSHHEQAALRSEQTKTIDAGNTAPQAG